MKEKALFLIIILIIIGFSCSQNKNIETRTEIEIYDSIKAILDTVYIEDQEIRKKTKEIIEKYSWGSKELKTHWKKIDEIDSINEIKVFNILDEYGWLGEEKIGWQGNLSFFLIIQHSSQKKQEKYLPLIQDAVNKGNADPSSLALLEDKVSVGKGEKQKYGSQVKRNIETGEYYILPLEDPDNIDKRRKDVGLSEYSVYLSYYGLVWNVKEYKKTND